ncbi:pterin cluster protein [Halorussus limi]|uniref:Pterin cluster protein n=1 Tax=Halorussus limi TaxID=2938695 RepID=A0A8U0HVI9_9EURY|nr:pterin cluster protein [Halorussus limi]UPV75135.1 pterin cluster protein [Halorussus limi]
MQSDARTAETTGEGNEPAEQTTDERETTAATPDERETTVEVRCTGHVRTAIGESRLEYTFEGATLRAFLDAFFAEYDVKDLLLAETEDEATTRGWADPPEDLPGTWRKNPEGEQTRTYARVLVDGQFNEHLAGLDTRLRDGDRVGLLYPFIFCC